MASVLHHKRIIVAFAMAILISFEFVRWFCEQLPARKKFFFLKLTNNLPDKILGNIGVVCMRRHGDDMLFDYVNA